MLRHTIAVLLAGFSMATSPAQAADPLDRDGMMADIAQKVIPRIRDGS